MAPDPLAVILAAGASTRIGGRPKALLSISGGPAIARVVRVSREEGFVPRVVVGPHAAAIRAALPAPAPELVENAEWAQGRTGSVQKGLEGVDTETLVLLWPVDHPFVQAMTLRRLHEAAEHDVMGAWFIPTFEGLGGHPVLLRPSVFPRVRDLDPRVPLRTLIPEFGPQVVRVPVPDPCVRANIDAEEDYRRYQSLISSEEP